MLAHIKKLELLLPLMRWMRISFLLLPTEEYGLNETLPSDVDEMNHLILE